MTVAFKISCYYQQSVNFSHIVAKKKFREEPEEGYDYVMMHLSSRALNVPYHILPYLLSQGL